MSSPHKAKIALATICIGDAYVEWWNRFASRNWQSYAQRCGYALEVLREPLDRLLLRVELVALVDQRHLDDVAFDLRLERLRPVEVEDYASAVARLDHVDAAKRDVLDHPLRRPEAVDGVEEVERDARRRRDGETRRRVGGRVLEREAHDGAARSSLRHRHRVDAIGRLRMDGGGHGQSEQHQQPRARAEGPSRPRHDIAEES